MVTLFVYKDKKLKEVTDVSGLGKMLHSGDASIWFDLDKPSGEELFILDEVFNFHPLAIEDCLSDVESPKIDNFDSYLFMVLHAIDYGVKNEISTEELDLFLGKNFVVTVHKQEVFSINSTKVRCRKNPEKTIGMGSQILCHTIIDALVDNYLPLLEKLDDKMERLEGEILESHDEDVLPKIMDVKKDATYLRRVMGPQRDTINILTKPDMAHISKHNKIYFRDIYDHLVRIYAMAEGSRDMAASALDLYLSMASNRMAEASNKMNQVMKTLAVVATLMMPLTLISGIYGMNFKYMPELTWRYGYFATLGLMITIFIGMLIMMKKRKWF